jgi:serine/threonine-protein kinase SRPK3
LDQYVAIKIAVAAGGRAFEGEILRTLQDATASFAVIPELLDEFDVEGPDIKGTRGMHRCLVTILARMNLAEARDASHHWLFQPRVAHAIAAQLIDGVAFMHSPGIAHAGMLIVLKPA